MKSNLPIRIPAPVSTGNHSVDRYLSEMRTAVQRLRDRHVRDRKGSGAAAYVHPFQMTLANSTNTTTELTVSNGQASGAEVSGSTTDMWLAIQSEMVKLEDEALTATVGVWVVANWNKYSTTYARDYGTLENMDFQDFEIKVNSTYTDASDFASMSKGGANPEAAHYVGKVILANSTWTVQQHLKSDITFPTFTYPDDFISTYPDGTPNRLTRSSTDNLLQVIHDESETRATGTQ